jgi:hypothetical protein
MRVAAQVEPEVAVVLGGVLGLRLRAQYDFVDQSLDVAAFDLREDVIELLAVQLAALRQPATYKRVEWFDESEGPLSNSDVDYPRIGKAAAFLCTEKSCSAPIFSPAKLKVR